MDTMTPILIAFDRLSVPFCVSTPYARVQTHTPRRHNMHNMQRSMCFQCVLHRSASGVSDCDGRMNGIHNDRFSYINIHADGGQSEICIFV